MAAFTGSDEGIQITKTSEGSDGISTVSEDMVETKSLNESELDEHKRPIPHDVSYVALFSSSLTNFMLIYGPKVVSKGSIVIDMAESHYQSTNRPSANIAAHPRSRMLSR